MKLPELKQGEAYIGKITHTILLPENFEVTGMTQCVAHQLENTNNNQPTMEVPHYG